jgi:hypothetical protein
MLPAVVAAVAAELRDRVAKNLAASIYLKECLARASMAEIVLPNNREGRL